MGTGIAIVAARGGAQTIVFDVDGQRAQVALRDMRRFLERSAELGRMTREQADASDRRNIILQALGPEPQVTIDLTHQQLRRGDTLILGSDGLSGLVRVDEMARIAAESPDVETMCKRLIARANELGGPDNITVIAARFDGAPLDSCIEGDAVGYNTYPLAGTLNHDTVEAPQPAQPLRSGLRSDPTPRYGTPAPSAAALEAEFARAAAAEDAAALGAPEEVVEERRRKVEPLYFILLLIAIAAVMWLLVRLLQ